MTREVLLDADVRVCLHDPSKEGAASAGAVSTRLEEIPGDDAVELFITPLVRHEVLRGIAWGDTERYGRVKAAPDGLTELDVSRDASELAADLFRLYIAEHVDDSGIDVNERRFDVFHFAVAKVRGMELISEDRHMCSPEELHARLDLDRTPGTGRA